jgi:hypothetical protein
MDTVSIETSVVSHATARPSTDAAVFVLQQQARDWWSRERPKDSLVTSQLVLDEASLGDPTAHVASAAVGAVQFLLTQNCRHIANAHTLSCVYRALDDLGYPGLLIYTPAE